MQIDAGSQILLSIGIPTIAILIGILLNTRQNDSLRNQLTGQIGSLRNEFASLRNEMAARFDAVDTRIDGLERVMNARFEAAHQQLLRVEGAWMPV